MRASSLGAALAMALLALVAGPATVPVAARPMWGPLGHYMTAAIAQGYLSTEARHGVTKLLPEYNGDLSAIASWADEVARRTLPWSPPLHYINTPDWACDYKRERDCHDAHYPGDYCVDGAIQNFTTQLVTASSSLSLPDALKFLVHFVGDIHQPLHVGFTTDEGGNTEKGTFFAEHNVALHHVWDTSMIERRIREDFGGSNSTYLQMFMQKLQGSGEYAPLVSKWRECTTSVSPHVINACSDAWASESIEYACKYAYKNQDGQKIENGFDLQDAYYKFALPVAEERIAAGGIRLANVLNEIFKAKREEEDAQRVAEM